MTLTANTVFGNYVIPGVPSSGAKEPIKAEIRELLTGYETAITAFTSNGGLIYATRALLYADLDHDAHASAWVISDTTVGYNGIYEKSGASGAGSWVRRADLPYSFIGCTDVGAGTANSIVATSAIPAPTSIGAAVFISNVFEANTGAVVYALNGATAKALKTGSGDDLPSGYLTAGMQIVFVDAGSYYRLVSDVKYWFIACTDTGAGTANAIQVTTVVPAPSTARGALFISNIFEANTGNVTLSINGAAAKSLLTTSGAQVPVAGLTAGTQIMFVDDLSNYRLVSDIASAAIQAAAEAAQAAAEAAQAAAEGAAQTVVVGVYNSVAGLQAATVDVAVKSVTLTGYTSAGDGGKAIYYRVNADPGAVDKIRSTDRFKADGTTSAGDGGWWAIGEKIINPMMKGADGTGVTNAKTIIDAMNVAGTTVDLGGGTYAYTGAFTQVAVFENGIIVSSVDGTLDYRSNTFIADTTITVGTAGTIKTLRRALDFLKFKSFPSVSVELTVTGAHELVDYRFDHAHSAKLSLVGAAMIGAVPSKADMVGTRATDEALILARFAASIDIGGTGDNFNGGLKFPNGLSYIDGIALTSNTRYSFDVGYNAAHGNTHNGTRLRIGNFAIIGGVWGLNAIAAQVRAISGTAQLFAYQNTGTQPGGAMDLFGCNTKWEGSLRVYSAGQSSKYCVFVTGGRFESGVAAPPDFKGPFLHGLFADACDVSMPGLITSGVSQPVSLIRNSSFDGDDYSFADGDVANTNTLTGAPQKGFGNLDASGSFIFSGQGCNFSANNGTMENMIGSYAFYAIQGNIGQGTGACAINNCKTTISTVRLYNTTSNYIAVTVTAPKVGSLDTVVALAQGTCRMGTNSGVTFSPAINTVSNGNLISNTG